MIVKSSFSVKLQELLAEEYKEALSENIKRGIARVKQRKNETRNN